MLIPLTIGLAFALMFALFAIAWCLDRISELSAKLDASEKRGAL